MWCRYTLRSQQLDISDIPSLGKMLSKALLIDVFGQILDDDPCAAALLRVSVIHDWWCSSV